MNNENQQEPGAMASQVESPDLNSALASAPPAGLPDLGSLQSSCHVVDYNAKGYHLDGNIAPEQVTAAAALLDRAGFALDTITGVDWLAAGEMELLYDYFHPTTNLRIVLRTRVPRSNPELPTISGIFPGANWHERETHDFFGIRFSGHPDLTPLLLPEDADYHPLRKDFGA